MGVDELNVKLLRYFKLWGKHVINSLTKTTNWGFFTLVTRFCRIEPKTIVNCANVIVQTMVTVTFRKLDFTIPKTIKYSD